MLGGALVNSAGAVDRLEVDFLGEFEAEFIVRQLARNQDHGGAVAIAFPDAIAPASSWRTWT